MLLTRNYVGRVRNGFIDICFRLSSVIRLTAAEAMHEVRK